MNITDLPLNYQSKISVNGDCWEWVGARNSRGYGSVTNGVGGTQLAHRGAYELLVGPIPAGLTIDHLCCNKVCVNPTHLEPVTIAENVQRFNIGRTRCARGHELSGDNIRIHRRVNGKTNRECRTCAYDRWAASLGRPVRPRGRWWGDRPAASSRPVDDPPVSAGRASSVSEGRA